MVINGHNPFGMKLSSVGPFINWQLISLFAINFALFALDVYRHKKEDNRIHWGWFTSIAVMYSAVLYGDMLHRMSSTHGVIESLVIRTLIVLASVVISLLATKLKLKTR